MSEEEIINKNFNLEDKIKKSIQKAKKIIDTTKEYTEDCSEAEGLAFDFQYVQKLLDLYKQEKEKNKELEYGLYETQESYKLKKRELELNLKNFNEMYISKNKIREKLKEYKEMLKTCNKKDDIERIKAINERILAYEELLEE